MKGEQVAVIQTTTEIIQVTGYRSRFDELFAQIHRKFPHLVDGWQFLDAHFRPAQKEHSNIVGLQEYLKQNVAISGTCLACM